MAATEVFAKRLKELRHKNNISQSKAAEMLGITAQSLSLYEKGQRTINIDLLKKVAEYFNVTSDYLIGLSDTATTDTDMKAVCEFTGLSDETINTLQKINNRLQKVDTDKQHPQITNKYYKQCIDIFINYYLDEFLTEIIDSKIDLFYLESSIEQIDEAMTNEIDGVAPWTGTKADELASAEEKADFCRYKTERSIKIMLKDYLQTLNFCHRLIDSHSKLKEVSYYAKHNPKKE